MPTDWRKNWAYIHIKKPTYARIKEHKEKTGINIYKIVDFAITEYLERHRLIKGD
jgi:hypothetical protein